MSYATKYYAEFSDTFGYDRTEGNLISGWTNNPVSNFYDTFTTSGADITSAITDGSEFVICYSNTFSIKSGDSIDLTFTLTLNSGTLPYTVHIRNGSGIKSNEVAAVEGANVIKLTATETLTDARIGIGNDLNAANWEIADAIAINEQLHDWRIEIQQDGFAGEATEMTLTGDPLVIEWPSTSDDIHEQNVRGSVAEISVWANSNFQYDDLFTSENLEYKVNIYNDTDLFWTGWITPNSWTEPYATVPYPVTISATDGLGSLKDFPFTDFTMTRRTGAKLIYDILGTIGFTEFTEYLNVYAATMDADVDDSMLAQAGFYTWVFENMNQYEVLQELLKTFNACIIQQWGEIIIYRYQELTDATMYGRRFTDATTYSAVTYTPLQYINRTSQPSNFLEDGRGVKTVIPKLSKLYITQDFGLRTSALQNHEFNVDDFSGGTIAGWTANDYATMSPFFDAYGEVNGVILDVPDTGPGVGDYIYQTLSGGATGGRIKIKFDYGFINSSGGSTTANMYTNFAGTAFNSGAVTVGSGWSGWTTVEGDIASVSGDVTVKLYNGVNTSGYIKTAFRNVEVVFTNNALQAYETIEYEVSNATYGQTKELEYKLGDFTPVVPNAILQYNGSITDTGVKTNGWNTRGGAENDPLAELIGGEIGNNFSRPKQLLDISIYERNSDFLNLFGRFEDVLNQYSGNNRTFVTVRGVYNVKSRLWDLTLSEII